MKRHWDIFCAVVDNYGDIGVCWRLARQLATEHDLEVRLWVDDLAPLSRLCPEAQADAEIQYLQGVEVRRWWVDFPPVAPAQVVIEAFACTLPETYLVAMADAPEKPLWINLEYLSAEDWVEGCHRMASPHPRLALTKLFFFPGFTPGAGGLLRERDYDARRAAFDPAAFRDALGLLPRENGELTISLFGYENPGLAALLAAWAGGDRPVRCLLPEGRLLPQALTFFGATEGRLFRRGRLTLEVLPFLSQPDYDALLWLCDLNFVRGEDSFVRAQWAAKPFVWHIYPQENVAHMVKLRAFLDRYLVSVDQVTAGAVRNLWEAWNDAGPLEEAWPAFLARIVECAQMTKRWAANLHRQDDLATQLVAAAG
ncbi:MAG: elongation factor P maturation arginine rhamnosyltransferase EarP [Rhodocyclaceae bacterium]|nr:MAG: elongation factor P maturation arginine rhamnosyltransferase EarP [Rhodocyclaceae bacterium]